MVKCNVCTNDSRFKFVRYFKYPSDSVRRNLWLKAVGREDLISEGNEKKILKARICEDHFDQKYVRMAASGAMKYLIKNAIPALCLPPKESTSSTCHSNDPPNNINTNSSREAGAISVCGNENQASNPERNYYHNILTKKRKLSKPLVPKSRSLMDTKQKQISDSESIDKFMPKGMSQLIKWQQESNGDSSNSEKRDRSFLCFALHLHYLGSTTYQFLRNTFSLPSLNTLRELVRPRGTKIDDTLFSVLKIKLDKMGPQEKICSVCVSWVPIKKFLFYDVTHDRIVGFNDIGGKQKYEPACYAVVIMVRGIVLGWKQLIGYAFSSQLKNNTDVKIWVHDIIAYLLNIGFDVRALVSDHTGYFYFSNFVNMDHTYFFIGDRKIYYIFDVPRLINSVKNNFMTHHYVFEDKVAKWYYIKDMYNEDKNSLVKLAPKLTENHFKPSKCVNSTAQLLSTTVAFAIKTLMQSNMIDSSAKDTIEFILKLDKLFDILNSSKLRCPNKFKAAFSGEDFQIDFLQEMLRFFRNLKLVDVNSSNNDSTYSAGFIKCFQVTIKSFLNLFKDMQLQGIKCIYTRRLNLDPVDNFFEKVNQTHGVLSKPICRQIMQTYNQRFVTDILKEPVKKICGNDYESLLALQDQNPSLIETFLPNSERVTPILIDAKDYQFELPQENSFLFVSVYLYKKCLEKHTCKTMQNHINICEQELAMCKQDNAAESYTSLPNHFLTYLELLDKHFCEYFNDMCSSNNLIYMRSANIGNEVLLHIQDHTFDAPCECFPIDYLKRLYVRTRIYHSVKKYNAYLKSNKNREVPFQVCIWL